MSLQFFQRPKNLPVFVLSLVLLVLTCTAAWFYPLPLDSEHVWASHLTLELLAIFVSVSVVAIVFQRMDKHASRNANVIVFGFTAVALLDFIHALSFPGMPMLVSDSSFEKAIFFWLAARAIELFTLFCIALQIRFSGHKLLWFGLSLGLVLLFRYAGFYHLELFPRTFDPQSGLTTFKTSFEYCLFIGNGLIAVIFWLRYRKIRHSQHLYYAGACVAMALCALSLTSYVAPSDFTLLIGHLFKLLASMLMYAALYWTELKRPYQMARLADAEIRRKDAELQTLFANIPIGIMRIDRHLTFQFINPRMLNMANLFDNSPLGKNIQQGLPSHLVNIYLPHIHQALGGEKVSFDYHYDYGDNHRVYREVLIVPETNSQGSTDSILCLVTDITEKVEAERNKLAALQETAKFRRALDEHAIVAFTDAKGVITSVNNKFCEISQYSREELLGSTHAIINSQYHSKAFFQDMWLTIARGKIWHGEICNKAKDGSLYWVNTTIVPFADDQDNTVQYIAIRADITERKLAEQEAQRLAYYDELTSLPNRRLLKEKLERTFRDAPLSHIHALLLIDLDNFKDINDSLGHTAGDELLQQVAFRLQQQTNASQTAARLGGDEFVLLISNVASNKQEAVITVGEKAENLRRELSRPYSIESASLLVTPSIGIAIFDSSEHDVSEFLKQADIAMYESKAQGRNKVSFFDPELQAAINKRNDMLRELSQVINQQELRLYYQPIYDQSRRMIGTEALLRWHSKSLGVVSPAEFIPMAEQSNLILSIGNWVLNTACQQLQQWAFDEQTARWSIAVNVSAKQLQQTDFCQQVISAIRRHHANPRRLKLEITESMLQIDVDKTIAVMKQLRDLGIGFSLDDFGTGYSSLSYLTKLPIDTVKIDRSFVDNMHNSSEDTAVVKSILSLATSLQLNVVAEGVETPAQFDFLVSAGCQQFQGYLLGKPVPAEQLLSQ